MFRRVTSLSTYYQKESTNLHRWAADLPAHCGLAISNDFHSQQHSHAVPQLFNLHLMYQSTVTLLQLQFDYFFERTSSIYNHVREVYLNTASQSFELLQLYLKTFGIIVMPPTFQYFASVVSHGMSLPANQSIGGLSPATILRRDLRQILFRLDRIWASRKATTTSFPT